MGAEMSGEKSASEAQIIQQNFSTRIGYERAQVSAFFLGIGEVFAGLLSLFGDFNTPEMADAQQRLAQWDRTAVPMDFAFTMRPDATVLLDAEQRLQKVMRFLNMTAKSGYVNLEPVMQEVAALSGLDPELVIRAPQPKGPEPPSVSLVVDAENVSNPIVLATLLQSGQGPTPQAIEAAKNLLIAVMAGASDMQPQGPAAPQPGGPPTGPPQGPAQGFAPPPPDDDIMPKYGMLSKINQRRDGGSAS